jgi:hypothetical protein
MQSRGFGPLARLAPFNRASRRRPGATLNAPGDCGVSLRSGVGTSPTQRSRFNLSRGVFGGRFGYRYAEDRRMLFLRGQAEDALQQPALVSRAVGAEGRTGRQAVCNAVPPHEELGEAPVVGL